MSVSNEEENQYQSFRDCVFEAKFAISRSTSKLKRQGRSRKSSSLNKPYATPPVTGASGVESCLDDPSSLADFSDYLASEIFLSLPLALRKLTYVQSAAYVEDYSLPLSPSPIEDIVSHLSPSVADTLVTYGLINPPQSDTSTFITPILTAYITIQTTPPPPPSTTRPHDNACELCSREHLPLTYHHLIPRSTHARCIKRGWHPESELNNVAWLCRACHSFVHRIASNEELARGFFTMEKLRKREEVEGWVKWVGGVRWKKR
jgi:hypothetical protein